MSDIAMKATPPGQQIQTINDPYDVKSIYVDGIGNLNINDVTAKLSFVEQMPNRDGDLKARYVVNLVMSHSMMIALHTTMGSIIQSVENARAAGVEDVK